MHVCLSMSLYTAGRMDKRSHSSAWPSLSWGLEVRGCCIGNSVLGEGITGLAV
jgi:hypothetical protein